MNSVLWERIATCFGIGKIKKIPGTAASFVALIFLLDHSTLQLQLVLIVLIFSMGVKSANVVIEKTGKADPREVVIDEVCGILVTFFLIKTTLQTAALGFLLFRIFDIFKPFPIRQLEKLPKGWGVMMDDVVAGLASNVVLQWFSYFCVK